jgi:hypothetical protein
MFKRLFCNADGKVSVTKIGGWLFSVAGYIAVAPGVPENVRVIAGAISAFGVATGIAGARDAMTK